MKYNFPYLNDSIFLKQFDRIQMREKFIKIVVLDKDQLPIAEIEGRATGGNINVDGSSNMRRTASLSMIADKQTGNLMDTRNLLSINKKIQILIGFTNFTNKYTSFPIIWFPQGTYVIFSPNITQDATGINISLSLRDKMTLLNGECGGTFPASVIFHEVEEVTQEGEILIRNPTIYQIILELVNHFGEIPLDKIIINDVDTRIKQIVKWTGSSPIYYGKRSDSLEESFNTNLNQLIRQGYTINQISQYAYGQAIGYILTDFIYPGELIANAGDTVTTILDNIKNLLGNFEYFFDVEGNFHFQQIKDYLNKTRISTLESQNEGDLNNYLVNYSNGEVSYTFEDNQIVSSISVSPSYEQIKNDFVIWGKRTTLLGEQIPIRYHLAIDSCPQTGITHENIYEYTDPQDDIIKFTKSSTQAGGGLIIISTDYRTELYLQGIEAQASGVSSNYYYTELKNEWPKLYDIKNGNFFEDFSTKPSQMSNIDYYLDIIDSSAEVGEFSIQNIGRRSVITNDDTINCIFEPLYPDIVFIESGLQDTDEKREECEAKKLNYTQVSSEIFNFLFEDAYYKSAYQEARAQLYQYVTYNEQVSLTILPIYYLEPNTRVTIKNSEIGVSDDYMIKSFSLPLDISENMTLMCTKVLEKI